MLPFKYLKMIPLKIKIFLFTIVTTWLTAYLVVFMHEPVQIRRLTRASLLANKLSFEPAHAIWVLWRKLRRACSPEQSLLALMTPKSPFEPARDFDADRIVKWLWPWPDTTFAQTQARLSLVTKPNLVRLIKWRLLARSCSFLKADGSSECSDRLVHLP